MYFSCLGARLVIYIGKLFEHCLPTTFCLKFLIATHFQRVFVQNVPAKSGLSKMCLVDNLSDTADSGGLVKTQVYPCYSEMLCFVHLKIVILPNFIKNVCLLSVCKCILSLGGDHCSNLHRILSSCQLGFGL